MTDRPDETPRNGSPSEIPGIYANETPTKAQSVGMRAFWLDGFFAWFSEWIVLQYLTLYALAFGASDVQIGYLAALVSLSAALAFLPGARLAEVWGRRKAIVLITSGGVARVILLGLAVLPFFSEGKGVIYAVMALGSMRTFFGSLGIPAWTSLAADIVPHSIRGRFFSSRNLGMNAAALVSAPLAGLMIDQLGFPRGWETVWLLALFTGLLSTAFYARIPEREIVHATLTPRAASTDKGGMLNDRNFLGFCAVTFIWNLALYIAAPFFNVHLIRNMGGSESWVGILLAVNSVSALAGQTFVGRLMDQRGARWLMAISGFAIVTLPLGWLAVTEPWHVLFINGVGGAMWAAFNLAWFSLLLYISPASKRAFYSAVNQMMVYGAAFVGPLVGGVLGEMYGLPILFLISGLGRLLAAGLFLPLVKELPGDVPAAAVPQMRPKEEAEGAAGQ
jgi:MFS family permease